MAQGDASADGATAWRVFLVNPDASDAEPTPLSLSALRQLILDGDLIASTMVQFEGDTEPVALAERPEIVPFKRLAARISSLFRAGDEAEALGWIERYVAFDQESASEEIGLVLFIEALVQTPHDPQRARAAYERVVGFGQEPLRTVALNNLAALEFSARRLEPALEYAYRALEADAVPLVPLWLNYEVLVEAIAGSRSRSFIDENPDHWRGILSRLALVKGRIEDLADDDDLRGQLTERQPVVGIEFAQLLTPEDRSDEDGQVWRPNAVQYLEMARQAVAAGEVDEARLWLAEARRHAPSSAFVAQVESVDLAATMLSESGAAPAAVPEDGLLELPLEALVLHPAERRIDHGPERATDDLIDLAITALVSGDTNRLARELGACRPFQLDHAPIRGLVSALAFLELHAYSPRSRKAVAAHVRRLVADGEADASRFEVSSAELDGFTDSVQLALRCLATGDRPRAVKALTARVESTVFARRLLIALTERELEASVESEDVRHKLIQLLGDALVALAKGHYGRAVQKLGHVARAVPGDISIDHLRVGVVERECARLSACRAKIGRGGSRAAIDEVDALCRAWEEYPMPESMLRELQAIRNELSGSRSEPESRTSVSKSVMSALKGALSRRGRSVAVLLWCSLALVMGSSNAVAQSRGEMLIDVSGSMNDNDSERLRWDGVLTFTQLLALSQKNSLGIRYFTNRDDVRVPHIRVDRNSFGQFERVAGEDMVSRGETSLLPALRNATQELARRNGRRYLIVISDGILGGSTEIQELSARFAEAGGSVYFVCLGPGGLGGKRVNSALVEACEANGGRALGIDTRRDFAQRDVLDVFLEIFAAVSPPSLTGLTDSEGKFAINASTRGFMVLDPEGAEIRVVPPRAEATIAHDIRLRNWNVVGFERPPVGDVLGAWASPSWRVVRGGDGQPLAGAHVYLHNDVDLLPMDPLGLSGTQGVENQIEIQATAEDLVLWAPGADRESLFNASTVRYSVVRSDSVLKVADFSGELTHAGAGLFRGPLDPAIEQGAYEVLFEMQHPQFRTGRIAHMRLPLQIAPGYMSYVCYVLLDGERQLLEGAEDLNAGSKIQFELSIDPPSSGSANERYQMQRAELVFGAGGEALSPRYPLALRDRALRESDGELLVYESPVIDIAGPGRYTGAFLVDGSVFAEGETALGGTTPTFDHRIDDRISIGPYSVVDNRLLVGWKLMGNGTFTGDNVRWSLELDSKGDAASVSALMDRVDRNGVVFEISSGAVSRDSEASPEDFVIEPAQAFGGQGRGIDGAFVGSLPPGRYRLSARLKELVGDAPFVVDGNDASLVLESSLVDLRLSARRGGQEIELAATLMADAATKVTIFEDQFIAVQIRPTKRLQALGVDDYIVPPSAIVASASASRRRDSTGEGLFRSFEPFQLGLGVHDMTIQVEVAPGDVVRRAVQIEVVAIPDPLATIVSERREVYWQHEIATLLVRPGFGSGAAEDQAEWIDGLELRAWLPDGSRTPLAVERTVAPDGNTAFGLRLPSAVCGHASITYGLYRDDAACSDEWVFDFDVAPLFELRVEQAGRLLMSSFEDDRRVGDPGKPMKLSIHSRTETGPVLESVSIYATDGAGNRSIEWSALESGASLERALGSNGALSSHQFTLEAKTAASENGLPMAFEWTSSPIEFRAPSWYRTASGQALLGALGVLLLIGLSLFMWYRPKNLLPVMTGRAQRISPDYTTQNFDLHTSGLQRFLNRGQDRTRLRIGPHGDVSFGYELAELGLGKGAYVDIEAATGSSLGLDGDQYLCVRGTNDGGSTQLVVEGHMHALFPGEPKAELCIDGMASPILLEVSAGELTMQLSIELEQPS